MTRTTRHNKTARAINTQGARTRHTYRRAMAAKHAYRPTTNA